MLGWLWEPPQDWKRDERHSEPASGLWQPSLGLRRILNSSVATLTRLVSILVLQKHSAG